MLAMLAFRKLGQEDGEFELTEESNPQLASCRITDLNITNNSMSEIIHLSLTYFILFLLFTYVHS